MINLFWLPIGTTTVGILPSFLSRYATASSRLTQMGYALLWLIILTLCWSLPTNSINTWTLFDFHDVTLRLVIGFDQLTRLLLIFIFFISFIIYSYARNYLFSDSTRIRFLVQFSLVVSSVVLLAMSMNLFTAFVAWQFIGINLYLLLNHYHDDPAANKAAKKKFIINRLGDCSFLVAIVIAYQTQNTTLFASMQPDANTWLICSLIFVSVMTKSAQLPFHFWLPDTMETPTPVSALMHAGVINAGAILLTRMSSLIISIHTLCLIIAIIGILTALIGTAWMQQQADTKRRLAYSTMGQMGYMIMQCGLGAFPAAIFHLMAHGFFKATLFLNAGTTLRPSIHEKRPSSFFMNAWIAHLFAIVPLSCALLFGHILRLNLPLLVWGFIGLSLLSMTFQAYQAPNRWQALLSSTLMLMVGACIYVLLVHLVTHWLSMDEFASPISSTLQGGLIGSIYFLQWLCWSPWWQQKSIQYPDITEAWFRTFSLNPLREAGDWLNRYLFSPSSKWVGISLMLFASCALIVGILNSYHAVISPHVYTPLLVIFLIITIIAALTANRNQTLGALLCWLTLFEVGFINIALFETEPAIQHLAIFHLINISLVIVMMILLLTRSRQLDDHRKYINPNKLPWRLFYLGAALLLLIGIPGTASFVTEFYILNTLLNHGLLITLSYLSSIVLLAIVVMHTLQMYVFDSKHASQLAKPIKPFFHGVFILIITINIMSGIDPTILLHWLAG